MAGPTPGSLLRQVDRTFVSWRRVCLGEMKACWVRGVALCLLLGPLAGKWRLCPSRCVFGCLGVWGGPALGVSGVTALLFVCRGQASAGGGRYCIALRFFSCVCLGGMGLEEGASASWLLILSK